jgi:hypothetical protein
MTSNPEIKQYKVIIERDSKFSGRFDPEHLESALNAHAADGWRVVSGFGVASLWKNMRSEVIVILEREIEKGSGGSSV